MRAGRSADGLRRSVRVRAVRHAPVFTPRQKLLLLGLNAWPLAHVAGVVCWAWLPAWEIAWRATATALWLMVFPPLAAL